VQNWLDTRHEPPSINVKEFVWPHMAGWYSERGCEGFYQCLWEDAKVVAALKARLQASGVWRIAEALAS
jgi:hypothetical protein